MFFEKYKDKKGEFRWKLKSRNGKIVASGESYKLEANCDKAISLMQSLKDAPVRVVKYTPKKRTASKKIGA